MHAVALGVAAWLLAAPPQSVEVPKLTGERAAIAKQLVLLRDLELQVGVFYLAPQNWRQDIKRDVIYLQSPQPGTKVAEGTTVAVWTFELAQASQSTIEVPDVRGKPLPEALQILKEKGLSLMNVATSDQSASVVDQFPRAGSFAYPGTSAYATAGNAAATSSLPSFTPATARPQLTTVTPQPNTPSTPLTLDPASNSGKALPNISVSPEHADIFRKKSAGPNAAPTATTFDPIPKAPIANAGNATQSAEEKLSIMLSQAKQAYDQGDFQSALAQAETVAELARTELIDAKAAGQQFTPQLWLDSLDLAGQTLIKLDRLDEASERLQLLVRLLTSIRGAHHWWVKDAQTQVDYVAVLKRLPSERRQVLVDSDATLNRINELANAGNWKEAITVAQDLIRARQSELGENHMLVAETQLLLAKLYLASNERELGEELARQALQASQNSAGNLHPQTINSFLVMGNALMMQSRFRLAIYNYEQALQAESAENGPETKTIVGIYKTLSTAYEELKDAPRAREYREKAEKIQATFIQPAPDAPAPPPPLP